ncbi:MAG: bifunctional glutamate N-acetyltransferase/amino-acid acetyltransferase ArgJ [Actinomycetota bacterium]
MSVLAAQGFIAGGAHLGIKADGVPDVTIVASASGQALSCAAVFTTNLTAAAPVQVSRAHLKATSGKTRAVVVTSGNANAATGQQGLADVEAILNETATALSCAAEEVLICQTGLIGIRFPREAVLPGLAPLVAALANDDAHASAAAQAILTTDTKAKTEVLKKGSFTVGGIAKGAAMLAPKMATMLAVITTDAEVSPAQLHDALAEAVSTSFNAMTVDGCRSTNDSVIVMASGEAGPVDLGEFTQALSEVCASLALQMVEDAEGASKVVHVSVHGAKSDAEAHAAALKVAESQLVKCSFNGGDPYWGRVLSELGSAGVDFDPAVAEVAYGDVVVVKGEEAVDHDAKALAVYMSGRYLHVDCYLHLGSGEATVLTCDLGHGYIDENVGTS